MFPAPWSTRLLLNRPFQRQVARVLLHDPPQLLVREPAAVLAAESLLVAGQERRAEPPVQFDAMLMEVDVDWRVRQAVPTLRHLKIP